MNAKTRKRLLALLKKRREDRKRAEEQAKALLASYNKLYGDFFTEKQKTADLQRRLARLVDGKAEYLFVPREMDDVVECRWRVSKMLLKASRDRGVIWDEVFRKLREELFRWESGRI